MPKTLKQCIKEAGDLLSAEDKQLLLSVKDPNEALTQLEIMIAKDTGDLAVEIEQAGGEVKKDGRAFRGFFTRITEGKEGLPGVSADMKPVLPSVVEEMKDESSTMGKYNAEYNEHKGPFDQHIALSIPGYREFQYQIGNAILTTFPKGTMLDIGASEGTQAKTITSLSNGNIKSVSMDPNVSMQVTFEKTSTVPGATFSLTALGMDKETEGDLAWEEDDGTPIHNFDPKGKQYDIVQESMVFQFINNDRAEHVARVAALTKDTGIAIFQEKLFNENWEENEILKNKFKALSFKPEEMTEKDRVVIEGMNKNMVEQAELEKQLAANFKYVIQIWDSGNFKGYAASNTFATVEKFAKNMGDTSSAFDTRPKGVNVEIAPNPADVEATAQFNELTEQQKVQVTREVAKVMFPKAMDYLGVTEYEMTEGTGGFMNEVNPSLTVTASEENMDAVGELLGYIGSQDSIVNYNESKPADGFSVIIDMGVEQSKELYYRLRSKIPQVEGFSWRDGSMVIGNFSDMKNEDFQNAIESAAGYPTSMGWFKSDLVPTETYPDKSEALQKLKDDFQEEFAVQVMIASRTPPTVLYQSSVALRDGRQTLKKYGLKPGKRYKTREVAAAMEARTREKSGLIERDDRSPESMRKIARWMVEEIKFEMQHPEQSGVGWYGEKYARAMEIMSREFPELATDQQARDTMTALIAITSDQNKVVANFRFAVEAYRNYRDTGTFKNPEGAIGSIEENLNLLGKLYEEKGVEGAHEYLMTEELVSKMKQDNKEFTPSYPTHMKLPMAAVAIGPKLGAFYGNLMGAHGYLTMDRWWMRSVNRYRGSLLTKPTKDSINRYRKLINEPGYTDDQVLIAVIGPQEDYKKRKHHTRLEVQEGKKQPKGNEGKAWLKGKDPELVREHTIEKAANTIYKKAYENLEDSPFNPSDREFMIKAVQHAQKSLKRSGIEMSIADIQAVLWYYEKRLYGEMGAVQTADISYEDAATMALGDSDATTLPAEIEDFQVLNQSAYQGSGVSGITKMTTKKIGTGEGTRAFGWGMYFAGRIEVATFYRDSATGVDDEGLWVEALGIMGTTGLDLREPYSGESASQYINTFLNEHGDTLDIDQQETLADIARGPVGGGGLYQVELAPKPDEYLMWDLPFNQQPHHIQESLQAVFGKSPEYFNALELTGGELYRKLERQMVSNLMADTSSPMTDEKSDSLRNADKAASEAMHALGIRGIKFLDAGSRGKGEGSYNYVIFNDDDVQITEQLEQYERGRIYLNDESRMIQLMEASDLSTFLHESSHLFLEMEKLYAKKYGLSDDQKAILKWLGLDSFDSITVEQHEKWAETFEVYLREGHAPSLGLRRAFAAFTRWLKVIYRTLSDGRLQRADLDPEIKEVFDRLLATAEEIEEAAANPQYDQYFQSKEASGMSDAKWTEYQIRAARIAETAERTVDEKAIAAYMKTKTKEWEEEKKPLVAAAKETLSEAPVYQLLDSLKKTDDEFEGRMDTTMLRAAIDGEVSGKLIGKHIKEGGVDPALVAEQFGFSSVQQMHDEIVNTPSLSVAAEDIAQAEMVGKYGDIINDGTLEQEVKEALVNEDQAAMLLMEIQALNKQNRRPGINREYLKAQAYQMIAGMTYNEIKPDKYYRAMVTGAKDSVREKGDGALDGRIAELANHYMYKEALRVREQMTKNRRRVKAAQTREYNTNKVDADYVHQIKMLSNMYDMRNKPEQLRQLNEIINFFHAQRTDSGGELTDLTMLDPNLLNAIEYREANGGTLEGFEMLQFEDMTSEDLQGVVDMLGHLRYVGGQLAEINGEEAIRERMTLLESIRKLGGKDHKQQRGKRRQGEEAKRTWNHMVNTMPSLANMILKLDGGIEGGPAFEMIYQTLSDGNNRKFEMNRQFMEEFEELMGDLSTVQLSRRDAKWFDLESGERLEFTSEEIFMVALYWGTESSREAIMQGHGMSATDVMNIMSTLSVPQLELVNVVWAMNETHWSELAKASVALTGVAPPKLAALGFEVNGVAMNGGHMQLMYDSSNVELGDEQNRAQVMSSVMPTKAASLNARKGSGGQPVNLDIGNITRSVDDKVHYISFAEAGQKLRRLVNHKDVKAVIERKHGMGFYKALIESITGVTGGRLGQETHQGLAKAFRWMRGAAVMMHLAYSIRNTMQQFPAALIAMKEVGPIKFAQSAGQLLSQRKEMVDMINSKSKFMENRASVVNREAREYMKKLIATSKSGRLWEQYKAHGFIFQIMADSTVAYPTWLAAYNNSIENHGQEKRARTEADTAVAQSVGSGSDLHLGRIMQSSQSEGIKTVTMFGSWFNAYYQRLYRSSKGGEDYLNVNFAFDAVILPFIVANITQAIILDTPDDDETVLEYLWKNSWQFMTATVPIVRELRSFTEGFTPSAPINSLPAAIVGIPRELGAYFDGRQSGLKTVADVGRTITGVAKVPGSGELWRMLDYTSSFIDGKEGDTFNIYQMMVEGRDKDG